MFTTHDILVQPAIDVKLLNALGVIDLVQQVCKQAELLFAEVQNALHQVLQKISAMKLEDADMREKRQQIADLSGMLQKEKEEFQVKRNLSQICVMREVFH